MINSAIVRIVNFCARHRWAVVIIGLLVMAGGAAFTITKFSINTDVEGLISETLPWHQRQIEMANAFPQKGIAVVVNAMS